MKSDDAGHTIARNMYMRLLPVRKVKKLIATKVLNLKMLDESDLKFNLSPKHRELTSKVRHSR